MIQVDFPTLEVFLDVPRRSIAVQPSHWESLPAKVTHNRQNVSTGAPSA